ncbi:DgyrCDS4390 [Dimorphilus gyrociliatus]|uniref:Large ribosomal subunit protein bL20m n=1 Tax=Dimorphilus gyrociliatus TaxID=2664684 RepID=A0A7I8VGE9_9ANNE|nr:DgyrCDS4390 [Dimorphilus gyrociliatus]
MVFLTFIRSALNQGPDKYWRIQQQLRFSWHFYGRKRNCYKIGMRYVFKALRYGVSGRKDKLKNMRELWYRRINAGSEEHGLEGKMFLEGLARSEIQLDRKILSSLAIYEPRTFKSLCEVSKNTLKEHNLPFHEKHINSRQNLLKDLINNEKSVEI